ncbi:MAG: dihydroorotate dehydrogenase [Betaproteobacteria bacterium]|nr:dihydroorotate dehydrogenase [Betaproteobacteria bacterium]
MSSSFSEGSADENPPASRHFDAYPRQATGLNPLRITVGDLVLKNPLICAAGEQTLTEAGIRAALDAGAAVVVAKSFNESEAAKTQLAHTDYALFSPSWERLAWPASTDHRTLRDANLLCRSGLQPRPFDDWLNAVALLDRQAQKIDAFVAASIILADLNAAVAMARKVEAAGIRLLEFNIGTPYADEATHGGVTTERSALRVRELVAALTAAVRIPVWVKLTGQSENVAALADGARGGGATAIIMIGRALGMLPDLDSMSPTLGTNLGYGGAWSLPLTCYWLARSRKHIGQAFPLIGTNGARSGEDVARMMLAGASAVAMGSAVMTGGYGIITEAIDTLSRYLTHHHCAASEIIGKAADRLQSFEEQPYRPEHWQQFVPKSD